ncbi:hypothetical protein N7474_009761 [Penicillium riverlandense]|uniref:uncharacterized protein n=1 Tax=Penicillium riverlandense TaxID=1903569 RepID=UPI002546634F|nr:uncharacterized protein N7474_009761 [Penicillium riverlandense]KAJ5808492.1 hypothetical protein N7474_009761 [Penicillium riverlandense]
MVYLVTTDRILAALEAVPVSQRAELDLPTSLTRHGPMAHEQLLRLAKHLQSEAADTTTNTLPGPTALSSLLRGTKVYVPPPPKKPEPTAEYLASKKRLLALQDEAAYQRLLHPTGHQNPEDPYIYTHPSAISQNEAAPLIEEDTLTPSLVINIFLSVLITGFSVYWALSKFASADVLATGFASWMGLQSEQHQQPSELKVQRYGASEPVRVLLSIFAALAVAVAEAFLYAAYLGKIQRARERERGLKERKVFVGAVGVDADTDNNDVKGGGVDVSSSCKEEVEIWGRGENGGVRRRVREKWQRDKEKEIEKGKEKDNL